jgi:predicted amidophosphoribosyltransferase
MDNADRAEEQIASALEASIAAARGEAPRWRTHCADCAEPLAEHRRERGRCLDCQERREALQRMRAVGV